MSINLPCRISGGGDAPLTITPPCDLEAFTQALQSACPSAQRDGWVRWIVPLAEAEAAVAVCYQVWFRVSDMRVPRPSPIPFEDGDLPALTAVADRITHPPLLLTAAADYLDAPLREQAAPLTPLVRERPDLARCLGLVWGDTDLLTHPTAADVWRAFRTALRRTLETPTNAIGLTGHTQPDGSLVECLDLTTLLAWWGDVRQRHHGAPPTEAGQGFYPRQADADVWLAALLTRFPGPPFTPDPTQTGVLTRPILLTGERRAESVGRERLAPWQWRFGTRAGDVLWLRPILGLRLHEVVAMVEAAQAPIHPAYGWQGETLDALRDPHRDERGRARLSCACCIFTHREHLAQAAAANPAAVLPHIARVQQFEAATGKSWQQRGTLKLELPVDD